MEEKVISRLKDIKGTIDHLGASVSSTIASLQPVTSVQSKQESLEMLLERCCLAVGVTVKDVKSAKRSMELSAARQVYCMLAIKIGTYKLVEIGKAIRKHHATVLYHIKTGRRLLDINDRLLVAILNKISL